MNIFLTTQVLDAGNQISLANCLAMQDARLHAADNRLRSPRLPAEIAVAVEDFLGADILTMHDRHGELVAAAVPDVWVLPLDSEMLGFFQPRTGIVRFIAWPDPGRADATTVAANLLEALQAWWLDQHVDGAYINHPVADGAVVSMLTAHGLDRDVTVAMRRRDPLPGESKIPGITVRLARPEDEESVVALHLEELRFHEAYTPYVRVVAGTEPGIRERLVRVWRGESVEEGASLVMVVERRGEIIGFTENWLSPMPGGWFPPGRYGYLNSVGVRADFRGQGIGRLLAGATLNQLARYGVDGFTLYFSYRNPLSSRFWPRLGFQPLVDAFKKQY